ncbi:cytochrome-c peroxidase [Terasakiella pusilla]|uniref:cytochrome-c peroxidase n=1 Tax=Terasakiella pusilla TaxID=64973 RepID=UPI00048FBFBE|nr:cytochrome-c peroxidase [Terasakiella pusilla]
MKRLLSMTAACLVACMGTQALAADNALVTKANEYFKQVPTSIPEIKGNNITPERIELGKDLFFDPRLSASHLISCNTCHNVGMGGDDNLETSIGHGWAKGPRNAPTAFNAVFNIAQFWDGRAEDLKAQAKGPVQAGVEMNNTPERVVTTLKSMPGYVDQFKKAFPKDADPVTFDNMAIAIEAFEATLTTPHSPFDKFLGGDSKALTPQEQVGLDLFIEKGCVTCHAGVNVGGEGYYPFGVMEKPGADILPANDKGRFEVTKTADDSYVFRAAPLRNIELTGPYFHTGKVWDLKQAVAIMGTSQLGEALNEKEIDDITAFLKTLTGEQPQITYPILPKSTAATPLPIDMQ